MPLALCCMSHSPLLDLPGPSREHIESVDAAIGRARDFVRAFDPELVVVFAPDHYNGFFYRLMPPFCIGTSATGVGDYGTSTAALDVPADLAAACAEFVLGEDVDVATSAHTDVDHGTVQPLEKLFGDPRAVPVIPVFVNSVATPLGPLRRSRAFGAAIGRFVGGLESRVLVLGSGGLSHDPPVPTLATAPPAALDRIVRGAPMSSEQRAARQTAVIDAAQAFASGDSPLQALAPDWDRELLDIFDTGRLGELDTWTNEWIAERAGNSAHEIRTWVAAFSALATSGDYETSARFYEAMPDLIAGFAVRVAAPVTEHPTYERS